MAGEGGQQACFDISSLPDISKAEMDFYDTSFFQRSWPLLPQLPSPAEILQQYPDQGRGVIKFEHLNLIVKVGHSSYLRLEEAQTMIAIRRAFANHGIPVPEVFGWRRYRDRTFIYMSLIHGETLRGAWPTLTETDKKAVCRDLTKIITALRRVNQRSSDRFIGMYPKPC